MNHPEFKNLILLDSYGELDDEQSAALRQHLKNCAECQEEYAELEKFCLLLDQENAEVPEGLLWQARQNLFETLRRQPREESRPFMESWARILPEFLAVLRPVPVMAGLALIALGFLAGYLSVGSRVSPESLTQIIEDPLRSKDVMISRVRFEEDGSTNGNVKLSFLASRELRIEGSVEDQKIQRLLAYALMNESNPGVRLRAVSQIQAQSAQGDQEVRAALIAALKTDGNPAVRQQALTALTEYSFSEETKQALLYVLRFDENARLRIEAINALSAAVKEGQVLEQESLGILKERMLQEDNNFVRRRTGDVLRLAGYNQY